jgi:hypothetical protein
VGFDRAMANFDRLRGRRDLPADTGRVPDASSRYPPRFTRQSKENG